MGGFSARTPLIPAINPKMGDKKPIMIRMAFVPNMNPIPKLTNPTNKPLTDVVINSITIQ